MACRQKTDRARGPSDVVVNLLHNSLVDFYSKPENVDKVLPFINRTSKISLRLLDHFVVNYSRYNEVKYKLDDNLIDVHKCYKMQLRTYSKKLFDPFARKTKNTQKTDWFVKPNEKYKTTLGQLSFLKWAVGLGIIDYLEANLGRIATGDERKSRRQHRARRSVRGFLLQEGVPAKVQRRPRGHRHESPSDRRRTLDRRARLNGGPMGYKGTGVCLSKCRSSCF
ncbi:hypothetical protein BC832DRAFT_236623 [Gaertneriomyces semiglobifer]|nr:hypothetical protein BC832DRAFT_236623 [Gaertneriomyces semiglobifer]